MKHSRRQFLQSTGVSVLASTQLGLLASGANASVTDGYGALVCVLLAGGADSFNMLLPYDDARYSDYANVRADLALAQEDVLPLAYAGSQGDQYAVHPGMSEVRQLFDQGDLAFVANIGPLAEPTTRAAYEAQSVQLPLGLFSHADQIAVWQTAAAGSRIATGFAGRLADLVESQVNAGPVSMNISVSGTNLFQTGSQVSSYAIDAEEGVRSMAGYDDSENALFIQAVDRLLANSYEDGFKSTYAAQLRGALDNGASLSAALGQAPQLNTTFSTGDFSSALAQIAELISIRDLLGVQRQTFFVTVGGWDHHDEVLANQARMLPGISQGLAEFQAAMVELGVANDVTTFTISDFGRTLTSNGRGSDHGWGGHNMVMGGAVNGGRVYGEYPDVASGSELDLGRGRFLPTTSTDVFYAELAMWLGVAPAELGLILPNINRFYDVTSPPPLGFMQIT